MVKKIRTILSQGGHLPPVKYRISPTATMVKPKQ